MTKIRRFCLMFLVTTWAWGLLGTRSAAAGITNYVSSANGSDYNSGSSWANSWATLTNAVAQSAAGDTVLLSNGIYTLASRLAIGKELTLQGFGGTPGDVIIQPQSAIIDLIELTHSSAILENLTVRNGLCGVRFNGGGIVRRCIVSGNSNSGVSLVSGGLVECSMIVSNSALLLAGGAILNGAGCRLRSCLVADNQITGGNGIAAGGVHLAGKTPDVFVENCTIVRNYASGGVGGVHGYLASGTISNSIVMYNRTMFGVVNLLGAPRVDGATISSPIFGGKTRAVDPQFVDFANGDYRLRPGSPAIDTGAVDESWMNDASDLDGNRRLNGIVDVGAYELQRGALAAGLQPSSRHGFASATPIVFCGAAEGTNTAGLTYVWDFENDGASDEMGAVVSHTYTTSGFKTVRLTVSNEMQEIGIACLTNAVKIGPAAVYVAQTGNTPIYPYASPGVAASNVQDAIDAAVNGSVVHVGPARYALGATVTVVDAITLKGSAGAAATVLDGQGAVQCLSLGPPPWDWDMTSAWMPVVDGLTICNGSGAPAAGVCMLHGGTLIRCVVSRNTVTAPGGSGGVSASGEGSLIADCMIAFNTGYASNFGGGVTLGQGSKMRNSIISGNYAHGTSKAIGGVFLGVGATVENCTVAGNFSKTGVGGAGGIGVLCNSIVYFNKGISGKADDLIGDSTFGAFPVASTDNVVGTLVPNVSGTTNNPLFVWSGENYGLDLVTGDYRLQAQSPAVDYGAYRDWMAGETKDVAGRPRVVGVAVDSGAHEWQFLAGTLMIVK